MKKQEHLFQRIAGIRNSSKVIAIIILAIAIGVISYIVHKHEMSANLIFTPELWDTRPMERVRMIDSLMDEYNGLQGMRREEVMALLGKNTLTAYADTYIIGRGKLGEPGISMQLYFDEFDVYQGYTLFQRE